MEDDIPHRSVPELVKAIGALLMTRQTLLSGASSPQTHARVAALDRELRELLAQLKAQVPSTPPAEQTESRMDEAEGQPSG